MAKAQNITVNVETNMPDHADRWMAVCMAGELVAMLAILPDTPANVAHRDRINEVIDRLTGAADDPDWTAPWKDQE